MKNSSPSTRSIALGRTHLWYGILVAAPAMLAGCGLFAGTPRKEAPVPVAAPQETSEDELKIYLQTLDALISNDQARQADVFYEVEREYKRAPTTKARLRYTLALVTPNHPGTKFLEGRKNLEAIIKAADKLELSTAERAFAKILYSQVEARYKTETDDRRVIATLEERLRSQASSDKRTIATQAERLKDLEGELKAVQQKLDALKEIERSQIERSPTPPGNRDNTSETQSPPSGR